MPSTLSWNGTWRCKGTTAAWWSASWTSTSTCVVSCGQLDNGTGGEVNGDTLFELGPITKTFTALLLQDMIERGEMKLDDPAGKHFPRSVKMPAHNGKPITLRHLVTHTSGLPFFPTNLHPRLAGGQSLRGLYG